MNAKIALLSVCVAGASLLVGAHQSQAAGRGGGGGGFHGRGGGIGHVGSLGHFGGQGRSGRQGRLGLGFRNDRFAGRRDGRFGRYGSGYGYGGFGYGDFGYGGYGYGFGGIGNDGAGDPAPSGLIEAPRIPVAIGIREAPVQAPAIYVIGTPKGSAAGRRAAADRTSERTGTADSRFTRVR